MCVRVIAFQQTGDTTYNTANTEPCSVSLVSMGSNVSFVFAALFLLTFSSVVISW